MEIIMKEKQRIINKIIILAMVLAATMFFGLEAEAKSSKWKKACKAYKSYLAKNESYFTEPDDFETRNSELSSKASSFMISDMNNDGIPELITYHIVGKKMGYLQFYTYKNKKVKKLKCKTKQGTYSNIDVSSNAAGWYNIYKDKKGYVHTDWNGGTIGYTYTTYKLKKGKITEYLCAQEDRLINKESYYVNMKSTTWSKYNALADKLKIGNDSGLKDNNSSMRSKLK